MRILYERIIEGGKRYVEAAGLSTEAKPADVVTGSIVFLKDASAGTWKAYLYEETSGKWTDKEGNEG